MTLRSRLGLTASIGYPLQNHKRNHLVETAVQNKYKTKFKRPPFYQNPSAVTLSEGKLPYHIVTGAFEMKADKMCNRLSNLGYKTRRISINTVYTQSL
jgi:hypothetical protein